MHFSSFGFFSQPFKNVKHILKYAGHTKINSGLDLTGGPEFADPWHRLIFPKIWCLFLGSVPDFMNLDIRVQEFPG